MPNLNQLKAALFAPGPEGFWGLPLLLWGDPGVGKTAMLAAAGKRFGLPYYRISPGERGEGQFGVVPVPGTDGFLHYPAPDWVKVLEKGGILFVDEINTAVHAVQSALLGLVQLRTIGSYQFGNRVRTFGAANETIDAAGGWNLPNSVNNRFGHLPFEGLGVDDWITGFIGGFGSEEGEVIDAEAEERRVLAAWPEANARARGQVAGFIQRRPDLLHTKPLKGAGIRSWPSRRSVEYTACALASSEVHHLTESESDEFSGAFAGAPWMGEFASWRQNADLPDFVAVVDRKAKFAHSVRRLDRTMAVLTGCVAVAKDTVIRPGKDGEADTAKRKARAGVCWELLGDVMKDAADVAVPAARVLVKTKLFGAAVPESRPLLVKIQPILAAAGIEAV